MEIERKWLLKELPKEFKELSHLQIEQIYISTDPEIRLRKNINAIKPYKLTVKGEGLLSREEIETHVTQAFYEEIERFIGKPAIKKDFYIYNCEGYKLEVSIVDGGKFIYAEVEFDSEEQANNYVLPILDAVEVTENPEYKMKNYWTNTR